MKDRQAKVEGVTTATRTGDVAEVALTYEREPEFLHGNVMVTPLHDNTTECDVVSYNEYTTVAVLKYKDTFLQTRLEKVPGSRVKIKHSGDIGKDFMFEVV